MPKGPCEIRQRGTLIWMNVLIFKMYLINLQIRLKNQTTMSGMSWVTIIPVRLSMSIVKTPHFASFLLNYTKLGK